MWQSLSHGRYPKNREQRKIGAIKKPAICRRTDAGSSAACSSYPYTQGKGLPQELRPLLDLLLFESLDEDADLVLLPELDELPLFACFWFELDDLSDLPLFCCVVAMIFSSKNDYGCAARMVWRQALTT
jgi:hypothetical protein